MRILGITGSTNIIENNLCSIITPHNYHDSSCVLLEDGSIVGGYEEERITRIKHTNLFPKNSIKKCFKRHSLNVDDLDFLTFSIDEYHLDNVLVKLGYNLKSVQFIKLILDDYLDCDVSYDRIKLFEHHLCHGASAYYQSGFDNSLILTLDGIGDNISGKILVGDNNEMNEIVEFSKQNSLGNFYTHFTSYLGFRFFDEYKVMGLAPYGNPIRFKEIFESFYTLLDNGLYQINVDEFSKLEEVCPKRGHDQKIETIHKDVAAALQFSLERIVLHTLEHFQLKTGQKNLSMAGGVAHNSKLIGEILYSGLFENVFVHPASADNGLSVGSALLCHQKYGSSKHKRLSHVYIGGFNGAEDVERELDKWSDHITFSRSNNVSKDAATLLSQDKVIGWVQGRSEFGPRALGNRSILADPRPEKNKERVNSIIKMREGFRPFAPSILHEKVSEYFVLPKCILDYSFMTSVLKIKEKYRPNLGAVTHVDGSARLQSVSKINNRKYWNLINHFYELTNIPMVLNTSFNNNHEPIVETVQDAIQCFLTNKLNALIVGDNVIERRAHQWDTSKFRIYLLQHIKLIRRNEKKFIHDSYLNISFSISPTLYDVLKERVVFIGSLNPALKMEFNSLWNMRFISLEPIK